MCCSCNESYKIFTVEFVTAEPVETNMEMYHAIAHSLFQSKVASDVNVAKNTSCQEDGLNRFGFELHLSNTNNPAALTLDGVRQALADLTEKFAGYSQMQIKPHEHEHA